MTLIVAILFTLPLAAESGRTCDRIVYEMLQGHYGRALRQLEGAKTPAGTDAERENLRGLALMMSGDAQKAVAAFQQSLELQPSLGEARLNLGIALLESGDYAKASAQFDPLWADEKSPLRARAAYHKALALDALGRVPDAQQWIARALQADPALDDAVLYSGILYEKSGDLQAAGRAYKSYLDRHADSTVAMLRFGIAAQRSGFSETARKYLRRVVDAAPDSAEAVEARKFLVMWE